MERVNRLNNVGSRNTGSDLNGSQTIRSSIPPHSANIFTSFGKAGNVGQPIASKFQGIRDDAGDNEIQEESDEEDPS